MLKRTALYEIHRTYKAKLIEFSGFEMPLQYSGIKNEHLAVRSQAGLFDVSHMGEILIHGEYALEVIQELSVNDASTLIPGKAHYTVMCNKDGGIIDDLLVYCLSNVEYMLVLNASNIEKDLTWIQEVNNNRAEVSNLSDEIALIALQGPESIKILQKLTKETLKPAPSFEFRSMEVSNYENILVSSTGYTGESGFELYCNIRHVNVGDLWEDLMTAGAEYGIIPCGLGARDTLRLEAGFSLYGNDISEETNPMEAGLEWLIKWNKEDFIGKSALTMLKKSGIKRKLCFIIMHEPGRIPRSGYSIVDKGGRNLGEVTSGGLSVVKERGIAMGYLPSVVAETGGTIFIQIRNENYAAEIVKPPFHK